MTIKKKPFTDEWLEKELDDIEGLGQEGLCLLILAYILNGVEKYKRFSLDDYNKTKEIIINSVKDRKKCRQNI